jgi:hypothetical protein
MGKAAVRDKLETKKWQAESLLSVVTGHQAKKNLRCRRFVPNVPTCVENFEVDGTPDQNRRRRGDGPRIHGLEPCAGVRQSFPSIWPCDEYGALEWPKEWTEDLKKKETAMKVLVKQASNLVSTVHESRKACFIVSTTHMIGLEHTGTMLKKTFLQRRSIFSLLGGDKYGEGNANDNDRKRTDALHRWILDSAKVKCCA